MIIDYWDRDETPEKLEVGTNLSCSPTLLNIRHYWVVERVERVVIVITMGDTTGLSNAEVKELCHEPDSDTKVHTISLVLITCIT